MGYDDILELVKDRSSPGVLILDLEQNLVYFNREAAGLARDPDGIPSEVHRLCARVRENGHRPPAGGPDGSGCALLSREGETPYSLRAFLVHGQNPDHAATHVMVLVEKVAEQHAINLKRAKTRYGLSGREIEIVTLVAQGLSNKDIACQLFISDHTVKDHLKNISRKMEAVSRSEIIAKLQ